jgi:glutaredoxin
MAFSWLGWWRRRAVKAPYLQVILYTRHGCHLCDAAWEKLQREQSHHGFTLEAVDVDAHAELVALYGDCVPVVTINGRVRFRGVVNDVLLARVLHAEARNS